MKILVVGSGGREHALCRAFKASKTSTELFCASGNAGIARMARCIDIKPHEIEKLVDFALQNEIDLTFVGGETALAQGIVDEFEKSNLPIIGPVRRAAQLEASKAFAKDFMFRHRIPTARYEVADSTVLAIKILQSGNFGDEKSAVVVKADGLAAGKGVVVAQNRDEAVAAVRGLENLAGKQAAQKIVIEEYLAGREVSLILFADGKNFALMPPARDHKRIGEGDTGANTGGMGVITNSSLLSGDETEEIIGKIVRPTLRGCEQEGFSYRGILFIGLMMTASGAKVLEYNVRFGDPETQAILVRLETDLVEICRAITHQTLDKIKIRWRPGSSACVVLAAEGYPASPHTGDVIHGLDLAGQSKDVFIYHAGTVINQKGEYLTAGGRVLGVTATGNDLNEALVSAYNAVNQVSFRGMQYRRDIGK
jgi:phosphoribosylamine---glycine ligase